MQVVRGIPKGNVVELLGVYVRYSGSDRPAILDVNLEVPPKKLVLITGPNGAGKTTLVETCLGLLKPMRGRVFLLGADTSRREVVQARRMCSYVPQDFMKPPYESYLAEHVILLGFSAYKAPFEPVNRKERERVLWATKLLGIEELLSKPMGTLSGGQQQKVLIARALARRPMVAFFDEPFASLDRESRTLVAETLRKYVDSQGATVFVVSHDISPIVGHADITVKLSDGRITRVEGC